MAAPVTANINIMVGGRQVHINPPNFMSLSIERLAGDACNRFTLQVLDTDAFELEYSLLNNTGGKITISYTDYTKNTHKNFAGYVLEIDETYHEDRMMLTLTGFVGLSLQNMYDRYSVVWNVVPKFKWSDVFSDVNVFNTSVSTSVTGNDQNKDDGFFEGLGNWFRNLGGTTWFSLTALLKAFTSEETLGDIMAKSLNWGGDAEGTMSEVLDNLKVDKAGNYYLPNRKINTNYSLTDKEQSHNVKQSGSIIIPMKPSKIIKLIARGGYYSELLEDDFENYKGTAFYNGTSKVSELDWLWIKLWFKKLGKFPGCGWKCNDADIEDTDMKQVDFTQSNISFTKFINDVLLKNCTITEVKKTQGYEKGFNVNQGTVMYNQNSIGSNIVETTTTTVKGNFYFYLDENSSAHLKRVNITNKPDIKRTYYLYGYDSTKEYQEEPYGHIVAFNANTKVLTSLIASNAVPDYNISNKNLVTGGDNPDVEEQVEAEDENLSEFKDWGKISVTVTTGSKSGSGGDKATALSKVQQDAYEKSYEASATIIGSCGLSPQDYIQIIVLPKGSGIKQHHTSGYYYILKIKETIKDGTISSELSLIKNVANMGNNNGIRSVKVEKKTIGSVM